MSEEDKHKLSKILYYSDIHPADIEFINNIIYDLQQENKQLKEEIKKYINSNDFVYDELYKKRERIEKMLGDKEC